MSSILIIDDDSSLRHSVRVVLSAARFEVWEAGGVDAGLALVREAGPDLVLCDLHLGRGLGWDVLNELRGDPATASLPLILITASNDESAMRHSMNLGADDFLHKPFTGPQLLAAVEARLKKQTVIKAQAERALRDSEARHRLLFESSPDAIMVVAPPEWRFVDANPATLRMFAASTKAEFLATGPGDVSPELQPDQQRSSKLAKVKIETALREGSHTFAWMHRRLTGEDFPATVLLTRMQLAEQTLIQATVRDLTEHHHAEEQLRKLSKAVEQSPVSVLITDTAGRIEYVNPMLCTVTGYQPAEILGQNPRLLKSGNTPAEAYQALWRCLTSGREWRGEFLNRKKNGDLYWELAVISPIKDERGVVTHYVAIKEDVTARRQTEQDLVERSRIAAFTAEIGKALTQNRPFNTVLQDCAELTVQHLEAAFARIWTLNAATNTLELQASAGLYTHLDGQHGRIPVGQLKIGWIAKERLPHLTSDVLHDPLVPNKDWVRRERMIAFAGHPLMVGDQVMGVMALFARKPLPECVSRKLASVAKSIAVSIYRHQAEETRQLMEIQLRQAQKLESIGQLAAGIAHEINSPMQYIGDNTRFLQDAFGELRRVVGAFQGLTDRLRTQPGANETLLPIESVLRTADLDYLVEEIPRAIDQSLQGVERVIKIVRAMKEFSHPGVEQKTVMNLNHAIESTITVARNEWKYMADLEMDFDPLLPLVPCLPGEFNQVILNLIINAAHAIADVVGAQPIEKGRITVSTRYRDGWVEIRVTDTGSGIPEVIRDRIFDPFFTTKPVGKGTGQGLAIARSVIVDKHGGTLTFETEVGRGTSFLIRLPSMPAETPSPAAVA